MPIIRSLIGDPTNFSSVDLSGANYVLPLDANFTQFLASMKTDGIKKSVNSGVSWSAAFGLLQGGPWDVLFQTALTVGSVAAGRILAVPAIAPSSVIYASDDGGSTLVSKALGVGVTVFGRGAKIHQTSGSLKRIWVRRPHDHDGGFQLRMERSDDGGDTWTVVLFDGTGSTELLVGDAGFGSGAAFEMRSDGRLYLFSNETSGPQYSVSSDEGVSWGTKVSLQTLFAGSLWMGNTGKSGYHSGDDVVAIAMGKQFGGESDPIRIVGLDASDSVAFNINIPTTSLGVVDEINYVSAVPGIAGEWIISCTTLSGDSLWIRIQDAGGADTVTTLKTFDKATSGEGTLSNLVQFGTP